MRAEFYDHARLLTFDQGQHVLAVMEPAFREMLQGNPWREEPAFVTEIRGRWHSRGETGEDGSVLFPAGNRVEGSRSG